MNIQENNGRSINKVKYSDMCIVSPLCLFVIKCIFFCHLSESKTHFYDHVCMPCYVHRFTGAFMGHVRININGLKKEQYYITQVPFLTFSNNFCL